MKISAWKFNEDAAEQTLAWIEGMKEKLAIELLDTTRIGSESCGQFFYKGHVNWAGYRFVGKGSEDVFTVLVNDKYGHEWYAYKVPSNDPEIVKAYVREYIGEDAVFIILDNKVTLHII